MMRDKHLFTKSSDTELEALLTDQLYRYDCAAPDQLQQYAWGMLATEATSQIEQHCHHCIDCRQAVAQHQQIIQNMATIEVLPERAKAPVSAPEPEALMEGTKQKFNQAQVFIAQLLDDVRDGVNNTLDALAPSPQLGYAALRGEATERSLLYEANGAMIDLQLRADQTPLFMISGQIMGLGTPGSTDSPDSTSLGRFRLTPQSDPENQPIIGNLSLHGSFSIDKIVSGDYQLTIELPEATYTIVSLTVD